jgi:glyoxylase-like metal-dependent hydrolase (beta-lactamase superfamily II)
MRLSTLTLALLLGLPAAARAHSGSRGPGGEGGGADRIHKVERLADGAWVITGQGGNMALFVTERSAVLVDDQFERLAPALLEAIRGVTDRPLRYVINTHHHADHTGGNVALEKHVQAIVAHANTRRRLQSQQAQLEPQRRGGLPSITFGGEDGMEQARMTFFLEGTEIQLHHYASGHTDGDVMVGLPAQRVLHLGDLFFHGRTPVIDVESGGSIGGMIANVEKVLSQVPDDVKLVAGHGPVGTKRDLARFRDFLRACEAHVKARPGQRGAELARTFDRAAFPDYTDFAPFLTWEAFFETVAGRPRK